MSPRRMRRRPEDGRRLGPDRVLPEPAAAREHREAPALGRHEVERTSGRRRVGRRPPDHGARMSAAVLRSDQHIDAGVARLPDIEAARQLGREPVRDGSTPPARRSNAARSGSFQAPSATHGHSPPQRVDAVVAAPRRGPRSGRSGSGSRAVHRRQRVANGGRRRTGGSAVGPRPTSRARNCSRSAGGGRTAHRPWR